LAVDRLYNKLYSKIALYIALTTHAVRHAADVELYSSTALQRQSALHLYSSIALYTLHPLSTPSLDYEEAGFLVGFQKSTLLLRR